MRWWSVHACLASGLLLFPLVMPAAKSDAEMRATVSPQAHAPTVSARELADALWRETNRVRRAHGRRSLRPLAGLNAAAEDHSAFMALTQTVQHRSPLRGQHTPADRIRRYGLSGSALAENVAGYPVGHDPADVDAGRVAAILVQQWLESPGHRVNLLAPHFTHFGGAVRLARGFGGQWYAYGTQVFFTEQRFGRSS